MTDRIRWDAIERAKKRGPFKTVWKPYGFPQVLDPFRSAFADVEVAPRWPVPATVALGAAVTGAFFDRQANPHQPLTPAEIHQSARECILAGASTVHIHVRDDRGLNAVDPDRFRRVIEPLRGEFPGVFVDGCLVCVEDEDWGRMQSLLQERTLDGVPVNTVATYCGDSLFAKPPAAMIEKTRLIQEAGLKVEVAVYNDADVDNANRYLIRSGLLQKPYFWIILPALPGCSPMHSPREMVSGLTRMVESIYSIDPESVIMVCGAGRASVYLTTLALLLGLHVRVGMEDTVWRWPHREELITSNALQVQAASQMAELLGRQVMTPDQYRTLLGLSAPGAR